MTALTKYQRLESSALWRDAAGGPRREVRIAMGDATLVISDLKNDRALAHWSLPAIERANPGLLPARFVPGPDAAEEIEVGDPEMVAALSKVDAIIRARRPHPGRLRAAMLASGAVVVVALCLFWLPRAIVTEASRMVPPETRAAIGHMLMTDVFRVSGAACTAPEGRAALSRLGARLFGGTGGDLIVLAQGLADTRHLPGGTILIGRPLVESSPTPEALAGFILAEAARADAADPLTDLLNWAGVRASLGLLASGSLRPDRIVGYAERLLTLPAPEVPERRLAARLAEAGIAPAAYATAAGLSPAAAEALATDTAAQGGKAQNGAPVLSDADWVALQAICDG
jgi:hypothetical protein